MTDLYKNPNKVVVRPLGKTKICERCGMEFTSHSNRKKNCDGCKNKITITDYDKQVTREFEGVCKRVGLEPSRAFVSLTDERRAKFGFLRIGYKLSETEKDRYIFILKKFTADLRAGMYDIVYEPTLAVLNHKKKLYRRMVPKTKVCPCHISSCQGAFYPGECPRNNNQCEMSRRVTHRNPTYSRDLADLVRRMVDIERSNREASLDGRTGSGQSPS